MILQFLLAVALLAQSEPHAPHLVFEKNKGQAPADVHYLVHTAAYELGFKRGELQFRIGTKVLSIRFNGRLNHVVPLGHARVDGLIRYVESDKPVEKDQTPKFASIHYDSLYVGIDLTCYGRRGKLECDFVVHPGADPRQIIVQLDGADAVQIDDKGDLVIQIADQILHIGKPTAYQLDRRQRNPVEIQYELTDRDELSFRLGEYNENVPLVIDPQ